jgi:hypothetical protein
MTNFLWGVAIGGGVAMAGMLVGAFIVAFTIMFYDK